MSSILFLDLDGVANGHQYDPLAESCTIDPKCVDNLNFVLDTTGCQIILTSAWRYMILNKAMTLRGFEYLLRTHRIRCKDRLVGTTEPDITAGEGKVQDLKERARQINKVLDGMWGVDKRHTYAVVDDLPLHEGGLDPKVFLQTDGKVGLTADDAKHLIRILRDRR